MIPKIYGFFIVFFSSIAFLTACGDQNSTSASQNKPSSVAAEATAKEADKPPADLKEGEVWEAGRKYFVLKVPRSADLTSPEVLITAEENGFFAQNGIKLDFVGAVPSVQTIPSVLKGILHTNSGGHVNTLISAIAAGAKVKAVAQKTESSKRVPHMVGIVKIDSPIKTAQDIVGKKVGTPSNTGCNGYFSYAFLRENGIQDQKNAIEQVIIKEPFLEQALRQGDIDVALMHKTPEYFENNGEFRVLFSDYDIWGNRGGGTPFFFRQDFIAERPDVIRGFAAAMAKTANWANENPKLNREITARRANVDINTVTERYYAPNAIIKSEAVEVWNDLLVEFKEIERPVPLDKIYTNEFNPFYEATVVK